MRIEYSLLTIFHEKDDGQNSLFFFPKTFVFKYKDVNFTFEILFITEAVENLDN